MIWSKLVSKSIFHSNKDVSKQDLEDTALSGVFRKLSAFIASLAIFFWASSAQAQSEPYFD